MINANAMQVLKKRYLLTKADGTRETPEEMFRRVADNVASVEDKWGGDNQDKSDAFYALMSEGKFLPNSPALMNAGTEIQQLSACFVLPLEDSMESIFNTLRDAALVAKSGGGGGLDFSKLRAEGSSVGSTGGSSSGPVSFMEVFNTMTECVKQAGKRRGALIGILSVEHPDIKKFIQCKEDTSKLTNFNISVGITDAFMEKVNAGDAEANEIYEMIVDHAWGTGEPGILFLDTMNENNPVEHVGKITATNPCHPGDTLVETKEYGVVRIDSILGEQVELKLQDIFVKTSHRGFFERGKKDVYTITTNGAETITATLNHKFWSCHRRYEGDNGKVGWHTVSELAIGDTLIRNENSAGDRVLSIKPAGKCKVYDCQVPVFNAYNAGAYISHNCGEIGLLPYESCNLGSIDLAKFVIFDGDEYTIDWDALEDTIYLAVNFLDNVIEVNKFPLPAIEVMTKGNRKIGLGIMGYADMLYKLGLPYGSYRANEVTELVMEFVQAHSRYASQQLAEERGTYPNCIKTHLQEGWQRNATLNCIAPTGTISMIAGCSSGCEPVFALVYKRTIMDGTEMYEVNPVFKQALIEAGLYSDELMAKIAETGTLAGVAGLPEEMYRTFVTAQEITPETHVRVQALFQKYVDNSISKTVNLPRDATKEDVSNVYKLAWELGCKGVTVYRDGCRENQVLSTGATTKQTEVAPSHAQHVPLKRPAVTKGTTRKISTGCGSLYVTINENEAGDPIEVFGVLGKAGKCQSAQTESLARIASLALKNGASMADLQRQLKGISCSNPAWLSGGKQVSSCADAFSIALKDYIDMKQGIVYNDAEVGDAAPAKPVVQGEACPECGGTMVMESGCSCCKDCAYSKCSGG